MKNIARIEIYFRRTTSAAGTSTPAKGKTIGVGGAQPRGAPSLLPEAVTFLAPDDWRARQASPRAGHLSRW